MSDYTPSEATNKALDIDGIKFASFGVNGEGELFGVMYDETTGVEYDVRRKGMVWNVNDDDGRDFRALGLSHAIRKAREAS